MSRRRASLFRYGRDAGEVLLGGGVQRVWRLDTREDSNDRGMFVFSSTDRHLRRRAHKLGHYIFAGGLRQHGWSVADDLEGQRRRLAIRIMLALAGAWLLLRGLPLD
ncbi:MAG: hypothetical protein FJ222_05745 [Lentisphaerae bacterium]|nr:hypothetical protein [Lentisphaerota bacterium]